jgi:surface polysaccharide O-acyltransferase-like enzyme
LTSDSDHQLLSTSGAEARNHWADVCRVIAIFGVILIHSCGKNFYQFGKIPMIDWQAANFLDSLVRASVPLFVMLSGSLILKPNVAPAKLGELVRRIFKVLIPLLTWNCAYLLYLSHHSAQPVKWASMLVQPPVYHLWFVYMIIGLYLLLPVFQAVLSMINDRVDLQVYLLLFWLLVTCVPIHEPLPLLNLLQQTSLFAYGGYFVLGGVIASRRSKSGSSLIWFVAYLIGVAITFYQTYDLSIKNNAPVEVAYNYFSLNVVVASVAAFVLLMRVRVDGRYAKVFQWVGDRSFFVFFVHVLVLERVASSGFIEAVALSVPAVVVILATAVATFFISLLIAAILRIFPASKTVFG